MKTVIIKVTKCGGCPHNGSGSFVEFCEIADGDSYEVFQQNKNGITPSCPMYSQAVEVAE